VLTAGTVEPVEAVCRAAGVTGLQRLEVPGWAIGRIAEQIAASVYSLFSAAPHVFGDRLEQVDAELRQLLADAGPGSRFSEQMRSIALGIWRWT
jgi:hypothetical protein